MSRQWVAVVRLFLLIIAATFLVAIGGGVFAQDAENVDSAPDGLAVLSPVTDGTQEMQKNEKPPLIGGIPGEPPPIAAPHPPSGDQPGIDFQSSPDAPTITIWHGYQQKAGVKGDAQKWVNIVGTVSPKPSTLTYSLNGGPATPLRMGDDTRRLAYWGDFNVELDYTDLNPGPNTVTIVAINSQRKVTQAAVTVNYQGGGLSWPTPQTYTYDWATASRIDDLAQVVDGQWVIDNGAVRPNILAYDRLIGIGDMSWRDYTVTVPITFTGIDPAGYEWPSNGPGLGILVRWLGHYNDGLTSPREGWSRLGALAWYHWDRKFENDTPVYSEALQMYRYQGLWNQVVTNPVRQLAPNITYNFKVKVESTGSADPPTMYRFKVWDASLPEPDGWDIEAPGFVGEPSSGGLMLVAHHVDARFGKVTVDLNSTLPPPQLIVNKAGSGTGNVVLLPSPGNNNTYRFGEVVQLTANPNEGSSFTGWQNGLSGNTNPVWLELFTNQTVTAVFTNENVSEPVSDDFSACELDPRWTFIDPLGHSGLTMTGSKLQISVPAGTSHDIWPANRNAPRVMQGIANTDFEVDVKFDSSMNTMYQIQGVLIEADATNFLRYSLHHDGASYHVAAYTVLGNVATTRVDQVVAINAPMYLRVNRVDDTWTLSYSGNGQNWTQATQFVFDLAASSAGVFAGNAGSNPAMVSQVDYFFNTAGPIVPQDNARKLTVTTAGPGSGSVTRSPEKDNYACNEQVTLEAIPSEGSLFDGWSGDLTGSNNPVTINMTGDMAIAANFSEEIIYHTLEILTGGEGTVQTTPSGLQFPHGAQVSLFAIPSDGHEFSHWEEDISGNSNPYTLSMDGDKTVKAIFVPLNDEILLFLPAVIK